MFSFFKRSEKDPAKQLKALLGDYQLPGFPNVVMEVLSMLRDPHVEIADVADKVQMDLDMSVKILRLTNSAAFGLSTKISNIQHAVTILGRSRIESLLLTYAISSAFPPKTECMDITRFWFAAARRACLARHVAQRIHAATQADSFTAALLQDLAIPLLSARHGAEYTQVFNQWNEAEGADLIQLEQEQFGYDHASIGALVAEDWGLSDYLIKAIAGHHDLSSESSTDPAVRLVSLIKYNEEENMEVLAQVAADDYGIRETVFEEMVTIAFEEARQFYEMVV